MKNKLDEIINRANSVAADYHEMDAASISKELKILRSKLIIVEEELIAIEDEVDLASNLLEKAIVAVNEVSDVYEVKHNKNFTQL